MRSYYRSHGNQNATLLRNGSRSFNDVNIRSHAYTPDNEGIYDYNMYNVGLKREIRAGESGGLKVEVEASRDYQFCRRRGMVPGQFSGDGLVRLLLSAPCLQ